MLRITKNEKKQLYNMNASVRRKIRNLKTNYNISASFNIMTPKQFISRQEVNLYKAQVKNFLKREHQYVKLGYRSDSPYYFYVTKEEYKAFRKDVVRQQQKARRLYKRIEKMRLNIGGRASTMTVGQRLANIQPTIYNQGLRSPYMAVYPLKIRKEDIHDKRGWENLKEAVRTYHTPEAYNKRHWQAQQNFISALLNTYGEYAMPMVQVLMELSPEEFILLYESDMSVDFDYIYTLTEVTRRVKDMSNAILEWVAHNSDVLDKKIMEAGFLEKLSDLQSIQNLSTAEIIAEWTPQIRTFRDPKTGYLYTGSFRKKYADMIDKGIITKDIINHARRVN